MRKRSAAAEQERASRTASWFAAVEAEDVRALVRMMDAGMDVDCRDAEGWTAAMCAAHGGRLEVLTMLLGAGADVEARDSDGWTAVMGAAQTGKSDCLAALVEAGCDVNARESNGMSVFEICAFWHHERCVEPLRRAVAEREARAIAKGLSKGAPRGKAGSLRM